VLEILFFLVLLHVSANNHIFPQSNTLPRTPLHVTQNMVDAIAFHFTSSADLSAGSTARQECEQMLEMASEQIAASTSMLDDVADLGKFDQGKVMHTHLEVFSLEKLGKKILQEVPDASTNVEVVLELGPRIEGSFSWTDGPELAMTDPAVLRRVLKLLVANAVDNTERGEVTLKIGYNQQKRLTFVVEDTGTGLVMAPGAADGDLPTIFNQYHQDILPNDTVDFDEALGLRERIEKQIASHKKIGLGNGLSLSYHLIQALGGELRCSSTMGEGTRFWFSLPQQVTFNTTTLTNHPLVTTTTRKDKSLTTQPDGMSPEEVSNARYISNSDATVISIENEVHSDCKRSKVNVFEIPKDEIPTVDMSRLAECGIKSQVPPSILVVEDTKTCAKMLCMILRKFNCSSKWVENGQLAVDILRTSAPGTYDLILMDLRMPVMDGLEATNILKSELHIQTPVVALTGDYNEETRDECEKLGFDAFQGKPMKRDVLKEIIKQFTGFEVK
jgi:CheY-like chemotaxis protein